MSKALDTNILVRALVQDPAVPAQCATVRRLWQQAEATGQTLMVTMGALLETEWVLRSRYKVDRASMISVFTALLETQGLEFEDQAAIEEALFQFHQQPGTDFADCLLVARALSLGCEQFLTFDKRAGSLPRVVVLECPEEQG